MAKANSLVTEYKLTNELEDFACTLELYACKNNFQFYAQHLRTVIDDGVYNEDSKKILNIIRKTYISDLKKDD